MLIFDIISITLLVVLLFWTVYNGSLIYVGIRNKRKQTLARTSNITEFPQFSIIVPTKNEEVVIERCLNGILDIDYPKDKLQVIIVDGNSSDNTCKICSTFSQEYPDIFQVIAENVSKGKPAALNHALPYVKGDLIATFDADSLPDRDVLKKAVSYFGDKKVMAIQGRTISLNEKDNALTRVIAMEEKAWFQALLSGREKLQLFVPMNGSCQFVRRSVVEELNGWDENSLTEDVEFALRLVEKNHFIKYAPDICSGQETPSSLGNLVKQRIRWYRGYMETALKYGRLLNHLNKRTIDAEISMAGPFMMVVSMLSYLNWLFVGIFLSQSNPILDFTGLVIALTAVSLVSIGIALAASEKPIKTRNILWIPFIYFYWLIQMLIASWAFLKLLFRRKRDWTKTAKEGSMSPGNIAKDGLLISQAPGT